MTAGLSLRLPKDLPDGLFPMIILSKNLQIHKVCLDKLGGGDRIVRRSSRKPQEPNNTVFGFRFSVKKVRIISKLKLKFVAFETELGIILS